MLGSNWHKALSSGALVAVLLGSALVAWTQAPTQRPYDPAERIMVVHENGKSTRCRVLETWELPDKRVAHLLQAVETGEKITIVDDAPQTPEQPEGARMKPRGNVPALSLAHYDPRLAKLTICSAQLLASEPA